MASDEEGTEITGPRVRAALRIELDTGDRQIVSTFREGILRWLNDRSGSAFARALGAPDRLSFDEVQASVDGRATPMMRLDASWSQPADHTGTAVMLPPQQDSRTGADIPFESLVFFPDPPGESAPLYRELDVPLGIVAPHRSADRRPQPRVVTPAAALLDSVRHIAGSRDDAGLGMRIPPAERSGMRGFALIGVAAVAAGFIVGTVYLTGTRTRGPAAQSSAAAASAVPAPVPAASGAGPVQLPADQAGGVPVPVVLEGAAGPLLRSAPPPPVVRPARARAEIADTEVRRSRPAARRARPVARRRPAPVVVRAIDDDARNTPSAKGGRRQSGALLVGSDPQGAEVSINGIPHGRTPLMIRGLGAGSRVVRLDLPGYRRWSWAVAVVANKQTPLTVKLQPESGGAAGQQ